MKKVYTLVHIQGEKTMTTILFNRQEEIKKKIKRLEKKDFLPKDLLYFLEYTTDNSSVNIRKKAESLVTHEEHIQGKSFFIREELYPYTQLSQAQKRFDSLLAIEFPEEIKDRSFAENLSALKLNSLYSEFSS